MAFDAIVLAGGFAKRMWPLTKHTPKQLLPVGGRPMLGYTLDQLVELPVVDRIYVSTNEAFAHQFRVFLEAYKEDRVELFVEPSPSEDQKLGAIGGLGYLIKDKGLTKDTMIIGGDNIFEAPLSAPLERFDGRDLVAVHDVGTVDRARLYGIVALSPDGRIRGFVEKPPEPPSTLAATALYIFTSDTMGLVSAYLDEGGKRDALGHFISYLISKREVVAYPIPGRWFDIGSLEVYREADEHFSRVR